MTNCWTLNINSDGAVQSDSQLSFIGGRPRLPKLIDIPSCSICDKQQSFMLQVAFPDGHEWSGLSFSIFACTSCADRKHLIPEMLQNPLHAADIPGGFLENYQKNFRFLVFDTNEGILRKDYAERVIYKPIDIQFNKNSSINQNKIGGIPNWILEDESPSKYDSFYETFFLLQLQGDFQFEIIASAPRQIELDISRNPLPSEDLFYQLFNGNFIYLFGVRGHTIPLIYGITQV